MSYPLVEVTWRDAHSGNGWHHLDEVVADAREPYIVLSVGHLVHRDAAGITIAQSVASNGLAGETLTIPAGMVRKVRRLR